MAKSTVLRPLKAIRAKCLDCCSGAYSDIRTCEIYDCPLWAYRMGKRPAPDDMRLLMHELSADSRN